jgi:multicomponent K+:H+ antiporter subunit D
MMALLAQLPALPVVLPLFAGACLLAIPETHRGWRNTVALASQIAQLAVAMALLRMSDGYAGSSWPGGVGVYLLGDWPAPFGIVLVVDRLSAVMLMLTALLGTTTLVYSLARWDRAGVHFLPLFQFLLLGLNGAFLTGDLFNLFVFFEVLLAASYGLILHGSGTPRVRAGLRYIVINLLASLLLLIGISLIYSVTGTLNMADLAVRAGALVGSGRTLYEAGAAILSVAFLIKAGAWPLNFWLVAGYSGACAPVAAVFSIMTKVGIYALLRMGSLLLPTGAPAAFGLQWMFAIGLGTLVFGALGLLATQSLDRIAAYCVIVSAGTLLTALGMPGVALTGPALFYLISSVPATAAFFMLVELIERTRPFGANVLAVTSDAFSLDDPHDATHSDDVVGMPVPRAMAFLGLAFVCCAVLVTGLPPLSGFVAKFALLSSALAAASGHTSIGGWLLVGALLFSGLAGVISLGRAGMRIFWKPDDRTTPHLRLIEVGPVVTLLFLCVLLTIRADPVINYLNDAADALDRPQSYIDAVMHAPSGRVRVGGAFP